MSHFEHCPSTFVVFYLLSLLCVLRHFNSLGHGQLIKWLGHWNLYFLETLQVLVHWRKQLSGEWSPAQLVSVDPFEVQKFCESARHYFTEEVVGEPRKGGLREGKD